MISVNRRRSLSYGTACTAGGGGAAGGFGGAPACAHAADAASSANSPVDAARSPREVRTMAAFRMPPRTVRGPPPKLVNASLGRMLRDDPGGVRSQGQPSDFVKRHPARLRGVITGHRWLAVGRSEER